MSKVRIAVEWAFRDVKMYFTHVDVPGALIDTIFRTLGVRRLLIVIVDEDSMFAAKFLVLLDQRLRAMYDATRPFGGIYVLLAGDFLQLPVTAGTDLYRVIYGALMSEYVTSRALMESFRVVEMTEQVRAAACADHCHRLAAVRAMPSRYPAGVRWTDADEAYRPITDDVLDGLTTELTAAEVAADPSWLTDATCLTTSNRDRAVINASRAIQFGRATG
jgi:hypothetical protein